MTKKEALEIMCRRCSQHDICQGTGCEPKRLLELNLIGDTSYTQYVISRIIYIYRNDKQMQKSVDDLLKLRMKNTDGEIVDDGLWALEFGCSEIAKEFVEGYKKLITGEEVKDE